MPKIHRLKLFRQKVERIDKRIIEFLGRRFRITKEIQNLKRQFGLPHTQKTREQELSLQYAKYARKYSLPAHFIEKIFRTIFSYSKKSAIIKRFKNYGYAKSAKPKRGKKT